MRKTRLRLKRSERAWLKAYRDELAAKYATWVEEMIVYGSKARSDAGPDSDLDVLLILTDGATTRKHVLRGAGHLLDAATDVVPTIMVYTRQSWDWLAVSGSPLRRNVERDEVRVL